VLCVLVCTPREVTNHPDYPGERLVACRTPALAESRRLKRESLLAATEADLEKIRASVTAGRLKDNDKIGVRVGKIIGKHKVGKHFTRDITSDGFSYRRDEAKIAAEAELDGIYVIRTTITTDTAPAPGVVRTYKNLRGHLIPAVTYLSQRGELFTLKIPQFR